jgi:hypothetical protein
MDNPLIGCLVACLLAVIAFAAVYTGNPILQLITAVGTIALLIRSTQGK